MIFLDPTTDIMFKKLFANQAKKEILISFLNSVLDRPVGERIVDVTITDPFNHPDTPWLRKSSVDARCTDEQDKNYIIEMQVAPQDDYTDRSLCYASHAITRQLEPTEPFSNIMPVIFVAVLSFNLFKKDTNYLSSEKILNTKTYEQRIKKMEFHFIELPKFTKTIEQLDTLVDKWIYLLKHASQLHEIPVQFKHPVVLEKALNLLMQGTLSRDELDAYDRLLGDRRSEMSILSTAEATGKSEGERQAKLAIAKRLLAKGMAVADVADAAELPLEEIKKLV